MRWIIKWDLLYDNVIVLSHLFPPYNKKKGRKIEWYKGVIMELILFLHKVNYETSKQIIVSSTKDDKLSKEKALIQTVFFLDQTLSI